MNKESIEKFLSACDDLITCKYLVAEYKLQKMLQELTNCEDACALIGDCLEQFNREREFSKTYVQDGQGDFVCQMPQEEFKIIALVFCTLVDMDNKKIDFTDFVKRFFGREENAYQSFILTMVIPFRNLLAEAFGYPKINIKGEVEESVNETTEENQNIDEEEDSQEEESEEVDVYSEAEKIAVHILSELQFTRQNDDVENAQQICRAIIKTIKMKDEDVTASLVLALKDCKVKNVKFYIKEMFNLFYE